MELNCAKLTQELQLRRVRFRSMLFELCEKISEREVEGLWFIYGASEEEEVDLTKATVVFDVLVKSKKVEDERESLLALKSVLTEKLHNQNVGPIIDRYLETGVCEQNPTTSELVYSPSTTNKGSGTVVPPFPDSDSSIVDTTEPSGEPQMDDVFFMSKANDFALENSEDPQTKVGAVIVQGGHIIAEGTNRMPKGCADKFPWNREGNSKLDTKYPYVIHASILGLVTALKEGQKTDGATIYTTIFPGHVDAQLMVECGIKEVVYGEIKHPEEAYVQAASLIFKEAGVKFRQHKIDSVSA